jgi:phage-related protein
LYLAQRGEKHVSAKPLKGTGPWRVGGSVGLPSPTCGAVYTVRLGERPFVLDAFQKKSKRGSAQPRPQVDLIRRRRTLAVEISKARG